MSRYEGAGGRSFFGSVPAGPLPHDSTSSVALAAANRAAYSPMSRWLPQESIFVPAKPDASVSATSCA